MGRATVAARRRGLAIVVWAGRIALAAVWIVEGLVAKVLGGRPDELAILAEVGFLGDGRVAALAIGLAETALGIAILLPWLPRTLALAQTVLLIGFNVSGLFFGSEHISDPLGMLSKNAALLTLAWLVAILPRSRP